MHKRLCALGLAAALWGGAAAHAADQTVELPALDTTELSQESGAALPELRAYAELGNVPAQYQLALRYFQGRGMARDAKQAAHWFRRAADVGEPRSQLALALMHAKGDGVSQSDRLAAYWMRQAAESGFYTAQLQLGGMYERGQGVPKDLVEAYFWYSLASESGWGSDEGLRQRERLGQQLTHVQRESARSAAHYWRPRYPALVP